MRLGECFTGWVWIEIPNMSLVESTMLLVQEGKIVKIRNVELVVHLYLYIYGNGEKEESVHWALMKKQPN